MRQLRLPPHQLKLRPHRVLLGFDNSVPEILEAYPELELEDIRQVTSTKLSEARFAKIWDSPEDAAYDNL
jgi:hypothetical protein